MKQPLRLLFVMATMLLALATADAQSVKTHKVKKGETIYGIAHSNGITEAQLRSANPGMERPDYMLKKGDKIIIPSLQAAPQEQTISGDDVRGRAIRMAVMLPLHDVNGDGRRMVEYYRGLLMACDSLKHEGISVDIHAWNTPDDADIAPTLAKAEAVHPDIIFGPLYSKQMEQLSNFCRKQGTMMVIPFSINAPQIASNSHIFQVYQAPEGQNESTARRFAEWFNSYNPIIVDCDDPNSTKGAFTNALRQQLSAHNMRFSLTSLQSASNLFASAFSTQRPNIVVLNSARAEDMKVLFVKLKDLTAANPGVMVSVFGFTEWLPLIDSQQSNFHKYDVYLPTPAYPGMSPALSLNLTAKYRSNFKRDMIAFTPPLALTGFDHALFFLRGLHKYGASFDGAASRFGYQPVQTPLKFEHLPGGGYQNRGFMFVHFKPNGQIETISY
ncbi:MAG: LysM peptidoglycan-binding domain-containing protein [Prevotella sp.]|nr:LysM peptidoglycan-binding domain-containing protein [Prevotella sp.]